MKKSVLINLLFLIGWSSFTSHAQELKVMRFFDENLAQSSYLVLDTEAREAVVIDPRKDVGVYLDTLQKYQAKLKYVTETHIHADFLSGARELAKRTSAILALSAEGPREWQYQFAHQPLKQGAILPFGAYHVQVVHTPGHTPESISFLSYAKADTQKPLQAFTGDFLFIGDVGRPDLLEQFQADVNDANTAAKALYQSIETFRTWPKEMEIWPGHGAGSFCGKSMSTIPFSTWGDEQLTNPALQFSGKEQAFIEFVLADQVTPPAYFSAMKTLNRDGSPLKWENDQYAVLDAKKLSAWQSQGVVVVDVRPRKQVATGYVPQSLHIELNKSFTSWLVQLVPIDEQVIYIVEPHQVANLSTQLMRIGYNNVLGIVHDLQPVQLTTVKYVTAEQVSKIKPNGPVQIWDIRTVAEFQQGHIQGAQNKPLQTLLDQVAHLDKMQPIVVHCQSGARAAIGFALLERLGFKNLSVYDGGINEWQKQKRPLKKSTSN